MIDGILSIHIYGNTPSLSSSVLAFGSNSDCWRETAPFSLIAEI